MSTSHIKTLLVPGGLGFIGSHTVVHILESTPTNVIIFDNLSNCFPDVLQRIHLILNSKMDKETIEKRLRFVKGDILELNDLEKVFKESEERGEPIEGIMHFAALKAVGDSFKKPLEYYENNVVGSMNLFKMMEKYTTCKNFIFSSSAAVYGSKDDCSEADPADPTSPYGESKYSVEMLLASLARRYKDWRVISLRYFNPCGAHESLLLGDEPFDAPNNLFPYIQEVIVGKRESLTIFGNDYDTPDGTCIRDYIHITDLANGHVLALKKLPTMSNESNYDVFNLGTSRGYSVLEVVQGFEKALGKPFPHQIGARRFGDGPRLRANVDKAIKFLGYQVTKDLDDMCKDSVNFILKRFKKQK